MELGRCLAPVATWLDAGPTWDSIVVRPRCPPYVGLDRCPPSLSAPRGTGSLTPNGYRAPNRQYSYYEFRNEVPLARRSNSSAALVAIHGELQHEQADVHRRDHEPVTDDPVRTPGEAREHPDEHERVAPAERAQPGRDRLRIVDVVGGLLVALEPPAKREHVAGAGPAIHADVRDERDQHAARRGADSERLPDAADAVADRDQEAILDDVVRQVVEPLAELRVLVAQARELAVARVEDRVELQQHARERDRDVRATARE